MSKRQNIVAGNWKMNKTLEEGITLVEELKAALPAQHETVILGTPFVHLKTVGDLIVDLPNVYLAAQNCHAAEKGAYTGEISVGMLQSVGAEYVILGHSERRKYFGETDAGVAEKVKAVLAAGLKPIVCVGEELAIREANGHQALVKQQISEAVFHLNAAQFASIVIAYEPVWAIGTGVTASPEQAQDMHAFIRSIVAAQYDSEVANQTTILYGGSCKPANAKSLFSQPDVDGGLIGGASLKAADFTAIVQSFGS